MKYFIKTIYFIFIIFIVLFSANKISSKENKISYKKEDISQVTYHSIGIGKYKYLYLLLKLRIILRYLINQTCLY